MLPVIQCSFTSGDWTITAQHILSWWSYLIRFSCRYFHSRLTAQACSECHYLSTYQAWQPAYSSVAAGTLFATEHYSWRENKGSTSNATLANIIPILASYLFYYSYDSLIRYRVQIITISIIWLFFFLYSLLHACYRVSSNWGDPYQDSPVWWFPPRRQATLHYEIGC